MDPTEGLFPELPENLSSLSDEDLDALLQKHDVAAELIDTHDEEFLKGISPEEELSEYERGVEQIERIKQEQAERLKQEQEFAEKMSGLRTRRLAAEEDSAVE